MDKADHNETRDVARDTARATAGVDRNEELTNVRPRKKRRRLSIGPDACVLCGKPDPSPFLNPSKCVQKVGASRAHRICESCWFNKFAIEGSAHPCPGCQARVGYPPVRAARQAAVEFIEL